MLFKAGKNSNDAGFISFLKKTEKKKKKEAFQSHTENPWKKGFA